MARAGTALLARMVMEARDPMRLYGVDSGAGRQRQLVSVEQHARLVALAVAGQDKEAAKPMSIHILAWKPIFTEAIQRRGTTLP